MVFPKGSFNRQVPTSKGGYLTKSPVVEGAVSTGPSIDAEQEAAYQYAVATGQIVENFDNEDCG